MPLSLDDFLNGRSIATLQTLQFFWAPATRRSASKSELLRLLRRHMLSSERLRERFRSLDLAHQEMLLALLRSRGYESPADTVSRRLRALGLLHGQSREVLDDLARIGLLYVSTARNPSGRDQDILAVPQEVGEALARALNLDIREPAEMLSLAHVLAAEHAPEPLDPLIQPAAIQQRTASLPDPHLQQAVRVAFEQPAGILPLERFPSEGLPPDSVDPARWRATLEQQRLGTLGHLDLTPLALGDRHDCLVLYQEVVQSHAAAQGRDDPPIQDVAACGIDFLTDLCLVVDFLRVNPAKLTGSGQLFKGARNQLLPKTACRATFQMDEDALLAFTIAVARRLGLLRLWADERLHPTRHARGWQAQPLLDQARSLRETLLDMGRGAAPAHFRSLAGSALRTLRRDARGPARWQPVQAFLSRVLSLTLMEFLRSTAAGRGPASSQPPASEAPTPDPQHPSPSSLPAPHTIQALASAATEPLVRALNLAGLLDTGRSNGRTFVRPSPHAAFLLGDEAPAQPPPHTLLLVNPDGEVVLFPEGPSLELLHQLCAFCDREKSEVTTHLRLSTESVQRAALRGLDAERMLAILRAHCRAPLPQNLDYSIRQWAASVHPATIETFHVLQLPSAAALDAALHLPELAPQVLRRLSPTAVALREEHLDAAAQDALARLGIHLV